MSINKEKEESLSEMDSLNTKFFIDSVVNSLNLRTKASIVVYLFPETNYTNQVITEKKGLLFCEYCYCFMNYGFNINEKHLRRGSAMQITQHKSE